jgi:hypothetical protein
MGSFSFANYMLMILYLVLLTKLSMMSLLSSLTWVCSSGTHGLVYQAQPIMEVDQNKDSTS